LTAEQPLPGLLLFERRVFRDERGVFSEVWRENAYRAAGIRESFVQDNVSFSQAGVLRGLHYQLGKPQGKLVSVPYGRAFDVAVDIRRGSPTFGRWFGAELSADNGRQLYLPPGYAHGFYAIEDCVVQYKCTAYFHAAGDAVLRWDDPAVGVAWPADAPLLSAKDAAGPLLSELAPARLPAFGMEVS
jgi:dTDP-4-dehydrorhamnose 3,5-epimerase